MSTDLSSQAGQGKLLLLLERESMGDRHSELAPDPLSLWPIFLKEVSRAAFLDGWCRNIDKDTLILLIQAHVNRWARCWLLVMLFQFKLFCDDI